MRATESMADLDHKNPKALHAVKEREWEWMRERVSEWEREWMRERLESDG